MRDSTLLPGYVVTQNEYCCKKFQTFARLQIRICNKNHKNFYSLKNKRASFNLALFYTGYLTNVFYTDWRAKNATPIYPIYLLNQRSRELQTCYAGWRLPILVVKASVELKTLSL